MEENNKKIDKIVEEGLNSAEFNLTTDYLELTLDSFLDNDVIKEIPVVKSVLSLIRGGLKVREIYFVKKLLIFLQEFHSGGLSDDKRLDFLEKFKTNNKYRNSIVEQIIVLNERFLEVEKSKILAQLFISHVNGDIELGYFQNLSFILDKFPLFSINGMKILVDKRLNSIRKAITQEDEGLLFSSGIVQRYGNRLDITQIGLDLYNYGIKPAMEKKSK